MSVDVTIKDVVPEAKWTPLTKYHSAMRVVYYQKIEPCLLVENPFEQDNVSIINSTGRFMTCWNRDRFSIREEPTEFNLKVTI